MCWPPPGKFVCVFFSPPEWYCSWWLFAKKNLHSLLWIGPRGSSPGNPRGWGNCGWEFLQRVGMPQQITSFTWDFYPWTGDIRSLRFSLQQCMMIFYTNAFGNVYLRICFLCIHQYAIYCFHLSWRLLPSSTIWFLHPSLNIFGQFQMPMPLEAKKSTDHKEFKSHIQKTYSGPVLAHLEIGSEHE